MAGLNMRLVHLDLKGAAPKVAYLEEIIPLLTQWGATGLLLEYEDMFPYHGDVSEVSCPQAYTVEDVKKILKLAETNNLEVMPLVQTFGHLEYLLKHETFASIREIPNYPTALCPCHPDSLKTVTSMVDQVLQFHPHSQWFHIGCDEVYHLGKCDRCRRQMADNNLTSQQLFFSHVRSVAIYVKKHYPAVTPVVWDDMFRFAEVKELEASGLKGLVEPMVWHYLPSFLLPEKLFENLSAVFPDIWVASAFKGATGVCAGMTNISFHLENHMSWLKLIDQKKDKFNTIRGFAITGWQRYDHFAVLCELLPVSLPSLALCLGVAKYHVVTEDMHRSISNQLGFYPYLPLDPYRCHVSMACRYPGGDVYMAVFEWIHLQAKCEHFLQSDTFQSWMNEYNVARGFVNPMHVEPLVAEATSVLASLSELQMKLQRAMEPIYKQETITEWVQVFLQPKIKHFTDVVHKGQILLGNKSIDAVVPSQKLSQDSF